MSRLQKIHDKSHGFNLDPIIDGMIRDLYRDRPIIHPQIPIKREESINPREEMEKTYNRIEAAFLEEMVSFLVQQKPYILASCPRIYYSTKIIRMVIKQYEKDYGLSFLFRVLWKHRKFLDIFPEVLVKFEKQYKI